MDDYSTKKLMTSANLKDIVQWQMKRHKRKRKIWKKRWAIGHQWVFTFIYLKVLKLIELSYILSFLKKSKAHHFKSEDTPLKRPLRYWKLACKSYISIFLDQNPLIACKCFSFIPTPQVDFGIRVSVQVQTPFVFNTLKGKG